MKTLTRRLAIGAAGAAAAALAWFAPSGSEERSLQFSSAQSPAPHPAGTLAALPQRAGIGAQAGEPFRAHSWLPPVPKAAAPVAAPAAPPNPYRFAGKVVQDGAARIFLAKGDRVEEAKAGEDLDDGYRVDAITAEHVVIVYVPLGTRDLLPIASQLGADVPVAEDAPAPAKRRRHAASFRAELQ